MTGFKMRGGRERHKEIVFTTAKVASNEQTVRSSLLLRLDMLSCDFCPTTAS